MLRNEDKMPRQPEEDIKDDLAGACGDDLLFADGFDVAIVGVAAGFDSGRVVYDYEKMIQILCDQEDGMTYGEAVEFLEFNTLGSYVGDHTPIYINRIKDLIC